MAKIKLSLQEYGRLSEPQGQIPKLLKGEKGDKGDPGERGQQGIQGEPGHTPVITASKSGTTTTIYADGVAIAQIEDGEGRIPVITAQKVGSITTIYVEGEPLCSISDGAQGQQGNPGHSPIITTSRSGKVVTILADGVAVGTVSDGADGQDGQDGHSPVVTASKSGKVTTISVDGTPIATVNDGADGQDGSDGQDGTDGKSAYEYAQDGGYTGTEAEFAQKLAEEYVTDVQVNGTSVVTNGVANVPLASSNEAGVVKANTGRGIGILGSSFGTNEGMLFIDRTSVTGAKQGLEEFRPVVPYIQHASAFYGLAKAAGDTSQASSSNAVGQYTDDAKIAIQKMLGIYEAPWELIRHDTGTNDTEADVTIDVDGNGESFELTDVRILFWLPTQSTAAGKGDYGRIYTYYDSSNADVAYAGQWTQASGATGKICGAEILQDGGMIHISVYKSVTLSAEAYEMSTIRAYPYSPQNSQIWTLAASKRLYSRIKITKVTGSYGYVVYGKRNWQ